MTSLQKSAVKLGQRGRFSTCMCQLAECRRIGSVNWIRDVSVTILPLIPISCYRVISAVPTVIVNKDAGTGRRRLKRHSVLEVVPNRTMRLWGLGLEFQYGGYFDPIFLLDLEWAKFVGKSGSCDELCHGGVKPNHEISLYLRLLPVMTGLKTVPYGLMIHVK